MYYVKVVSVAKTSLRTDLNRQTDRQIDNVYWSNNNNVSKIKYTHARAHTHTKANKIYAHRKLINN